MHNPTYIHAIYIHIYIFIFILMQDIIAIIYDYVFPNEEKKLKKKRDTTTYASSIPNVKRVSFSVEFKRSARLSRVEKYNSLELPAPSTDPVFCARSSCPRADARPLDLRVAFYSLPLFFYPHNFLQFSIFSTHRATYS